MRRSAPCESGCALADPDLILAKLATIDRCLQRIEQTTSDRRPALQPIDVEDILVINLQRAVQTAIDIAMHIVASEGYGLPDSNAAAFALLARNGIINPDLAEQLRRMVGFRNIAVHEYQTLDSDMIEEIVTRHLDDLRTFSAIVVDRFMS